jgi:predicted DNA-binding transcriptional regulator YafY
MEGIVDLLWVAVLPFLIFAAVRYNKRVQRLEDIEQAEAAQRQPQARFTPLTEKQRRALQLKPIDAGTKRPVAKHSSAQTLKFIYEDAHGEITTRELRSWRESGMYIEGYCLSANDTRTFRRDRIVSFLSGEELLSRSRPSAPARPAAARRQQLEVLVTGFPHDYRVELEQAAIAANIKVRKTVTQNLDFLVVGENAGPSKKREASIVGAAILSEREFQWLIETGELPEAI